MPEWLEDKEVRSPSKRTVSTEKVPNRGTTTGREQPVTETFASNHHLILHRGDKYMFGHYPKERFGKDELLLWRVLNVDYEKGRALLITENLIDCREYHAEWRSVTWADCDLRKWLNGEFIDKAFDKEDLGKIAEMSIQNPDNTEYGTKGGRETRDRVFVLSIDEVETYFRDNIDRRAAVTSYADSRGGYSYNKYTTLDGQPAGWWWLRSPGIFDNNASIVNADGGVYLSGRFVDGNHVSVRPALWLNL